MADKDDKVWVYGLEEPTEEVPAPRRPEVRDDWGDPGGDGSGTDRGGSSGGRLNPRALLLSVLAGAVIGVTVWAAFLRPPAGPEPVLYQVVAGDSLWRIANSHGVTVGQLKEWNGLRSDAIDVGQVLRIFPPDGSSDVEARSPAGRRGHIHGGQISPTPAAQDPGGLVLPAPKPCLTVDDSQLGDQDMVAAAGLSYAQTKAALDAFLPTLSRCMDVGDAVSGSATFQLTVGCNGRVQEVQVVDHGNLDADLLRCVQDTLAYVPFPAHDMPDGFTFAYPMSFEF